MNISVQSPGQLPQADTLVIGYFHRQPADAHPLWSKIPTTAKSIIKRLLADKEFTGAWGTTRTIPLSSGRVKNILLYGWGAEGEVSLRKIRIAARRFSRLSHEQRWRSLVIDTISLGSLATAESLGQTAANLVLGDYEYHGPKAPPPGGWPSLQKVVLLSSVLLAAARVVVHESVVIAESVNACRSMANMPGGEMTPTTLAQQAVKLARAAKLTSRVLGQSAMAKLKMGAILGVAKGSTEEPKLIILEYHGGKKSAAPLAFVGKGVTFDSGGLSLKPEKAMLDMHMDMAGGAAVIAAITAVANLQLPINVVAVIPAVENMPSGSSFRPGDLLTSMSGKIIEVLNTDAEGRVILADGLTYVQKMYKPKVVIDVATLTGSAVVALGQRAIAAFTRHQSLEDAARQIGEASGDYTWPLPMWDEYEPEVFGTFGDVANVGKSRYGDAISGAMFLWQFIKKTPWVHLDIAPTMTPAEGDALAKGATGTGVRWMVEFARRMAGGEITI